MNYHYLIGVGTNDIRSTEPGKLYLDSFFEFTDKDKENVNNCRLLSKDKLFKSSVHDSSVVFDCSHIVASFQGLLIRARAQNTILLHYVSDNKLDRKFFESWITVTTLEELQKAKIF
jgi:hypothetical protein